MNDFRHDIRAAFARQQLALGNPSEAQPRLLRHALEEAHRPNRLFAFAGAAGTLAVAGAIAIAVLLTHGHLRPKPAAPMTVEQALTAGPAAAAAARSDRAFVWLTGDLVAPAATGNQGGRVTGITVEVIDWTGTLRYHFDVPNARPGLPTEIQSISPDGTRALLADGTVIDQTGTIVAKLPALTIQGMPSGNQTHWMADDRHICASTSNEVVASYPPTHPKGAPNATPTPAQPFTLPGADHSVTLKVFGLDGSVRTVATLGTGSLGEPSGPMGDSTSVLSCSSSTDLAVVARYHDADNSGGNSSTNMTVSLWAVKLSTGVVVYHQPETRMALGREFFFGSQNARLAVEFLWNSKVWGAETDQVLQIPSGQPVPVVDVERIPDTPGVSADGTRILRRLVDDAHNQTYLELIDAASGRIIRRVALPGMLGATAVAEPGGSSFMVQVENYFVLVDGNGGVSQLHPDLNLGQANAPSSVGLPPTAVQN